MKKNKIDIICPLYNASSYIEKLDKSLKMQKDYKKIKKNSFSHSLVREKEGLESNSDILVFITQDIEINDNKWLFNLTKDINDSIVASYSRQISKYNNIEKYTREKNYPEDSFIVSKEDIDKLGLKTFFFSDAASCIKTSVFKELKGYDNKDLPISEDMYIAYKIIMSGKKIKYCADSVVNHSHNFTLKELYNRYKLTGKFFKENNYLDKYGTNSSGANLAKYVLKRILKEKRIGLLFRFPFDMGARFIGMKVGKR